jgi:hypothetical protein
MTPSRSLAPWTFEVPVRRFQNYEAAVKAMADYQAALCDNASRRRANGLAVTDQDQPDEAFGLFPRRPGQPPLAIVGGMGPLAGAQAFRQACARFQDSRDMVLYQACSMPDRSTVILRERHADTASCRAVALRLAGAVRSAVDLAGSTVQPVRCVIACNSAHYFWPLVEADLRRTPPQQGEVRRRCEDRPAKGRCCSQPRAPASDRYSQSPAGTPALRSTSRHSH